MPHVMPLATLPLIVVCAVLALPVLAVMASWATFDAAALDTLRHQLDTVLAGYALGSLALVVPVGVGVALVGGMAAALVTLFRFPGRGVLEWALLLPLAMPAYVLAYVYTDTLQSSGPLQTWLRGRTGAVGALWPDVRSTGGAVILFVLALYPYVYLLTRTALTERGAVLMEAARLLGAGLGRRIVRVALPLARPALAAGVALALMETLADYGVGSYFGLSTFTTGIYKAWLSFGDRHAAAQLATVLLAVVAVLVALERRAQARLRFATSRGPGSSPEAQPIVLRGAASWAAFGACALPVVLGFVLPVALLLRLVLEEALHGEFGLPWTRFGDWALTSLRLAGGAALLTTALALLLAFAVRQQPTPWLRAGTRLVGLGAGALARERRRHAADQHVAGPALRLCGALLGGGAAVGRGRLRAPARQPRRDRAHARRRPRAAVRAHPPAAADALGAGGGAAGVRRRDEGAAGDAGAATLQQRHAGRRRLPARPR